MVTGQTVLLLWAASACGWMCICALAEVDLELQLADDWINLSDKKRRERKHIARFLLLAGALLALSLCTMSAWLVVPAVVLLGSALGARAAAARSSGPRPAQTLNVGLASIDVSGPALRAAVAMLLAMGCLSVALGHIAGPWITAEVHDHLRDRARLGPAGEGDPRDVHGHVASRLADSANGGGGGGGVQNRHLRHLMHVHDVLAAHAQNGTSVRRGLGHHLRTLGHIVAASTEVAGLVGRGVRHHVASGERAHGRHLQRGASPLTRPLTPAICTAAA